MPVVPVVPGGAWWCLVVPVVPVVRGEEERGSGARAVCVPRAVYSGVVKKTDGV